MNNYHKDISITGKSVIPAAATSIPYQDATSAKTNQRGLSPYFKLLNGKWDFMFCENEFDIPDGFYSHEYNDEYWDSIAVPSSWQVLGYDTAQYLNTRYPYPVDPPHIPDMNPVGLYRTVFVLSEAFKDRNTVIHFGGVNSSFNLYVNGREVGYSQGSHMPSEFDITEYVQPGANLIAVAVFKMSATSYFECQDFYRHSGIFREVYIYSNNKDYIKDFHVKTTTNDIFVSVKTQAKKGCKITYELFDDSDVSIFSKTTSAQFIDMNVQGVLPWTAETPNLYTLILTLKDAKGVVCDVRTCKTGFRTISITDGIFMINNTPVKLKGVNRHDTYALTGHAISYEVMKSDVIMMKRHNVNTVRTSHYPNDPYFYQLCDEYGIYVIDEADIETHGFGYKQPEYDISDKPEWKHQFVSRAQRMVERDKNHPSIIMWSLGNEARYGDNHKAMIKYIRTVDDRPVHFERAERDEMVDLISCMYTNHENLEKEGELSDSRPFFLCEYAHGMGTGPGALMDYWDIIYKYPRLMGGCVWEWADHGFLSYSEDFIPFISHGGDTPHLPNDNNFCLDGYNSADRIPRTAMIELRKCYEPVKVLEYNKNENTVAIKNMQDFSDASNISAYYELTKDGNVLYTGNIDTLDLMAQQTKHYSLDFDANIPGDVQLTFYFEYKDGTPYAEKGYEVSRTQIIIDEKFDFKKPAEKSPLRYLETKTEHLVLGEDFKASFSKVYGTLNSYSFNNNEMILGNGLVENFYRAPTDNDMHVKHKWHEYGLDKLQKRIESYVFNPSDKHCTFNVVSVFAAPAKKPVLKTYTTYTVYTNGQVNVDCSYEPLNDFIDFQFKDDKWEYLFLPRFGLCMQIPDEYEYVKWYGRGMHQSYEDMKDSAVIGIYETIVQDLDEGYEKPQENGNRRDTRWFSLKNASGQGLFFAGWNTINFSAQLYDIEQMEYADHSYKLVGDGTIYVNIDYKQSGLGTNSCGPIPLDKHLLFTNPNKFGFTFAPFSDSVIDEHIMYTFRHLD